MTEGTYSVYPPGGRGIRSVSPGEITVSNTILSSEPSSQVSVSSRDIGEMTEILKHSVN